MPVLSCIECSLELFALCATEWRPTKTLPFSSRPLKASLGPFADLLAFEFGKRGEDRKQDIAHQFIVSRQEGLGQAVKADTMRIKACQVGNRRRHTFAAEAIERLNENHVEFSTPRICEKSGELLTLVSALGAAVLIHILAHYRVTHARHSLQNLGAPRRLRE